MTTTLPSAEQLSEKFCEILNDWLGRETIAEINARNGSPDYEGCCASHDFCDANQAMADALESFGIEFHPDLCPLINDAWDLAREHGFRDTSKGQS